MGSSYNGPRPYGHRLDGDEIVNAPLSCMIGLNFILVDKAYCENVIWDFMFCVSEK